MKRSQKKPAGSLRIELDCCECGMPVFSLPGDVGRVTCGSCIARQAAPPEGMKKSTSPDEKRQQGWHFMKKYESPSGKKYVYGKEVKEFPKRIPKKIVHRKSSDEE